MSYLNIIKSNAIREYVKKKEDSFSAHELCAVIAVYRQSKLSDRLSAYEEIFNIKSMSEDMPWFISENIKAAEKFCSLGEYQVICYEQDLRSWEEIINSQDSGNEQEDIIYSDFKEAVAAALEKSKNAPTDDFFYHYPVIVNGDVAVTINLQGEITDIGTYQSKFKSNDCFYKNGIEIHVPFNNGDIVSVKDEIMIYNEKKPDSDIAKVTLIDMYDDCVETNEGISYPIAEMEFADSEIVERYEDILEIMGDEFYEDDEFFDEFEEE